MSCASQASAELSPELWLDLIGVRYVEDGRDARGGLDCLGLVLEVSRRRGYDLPDPTASRLVEEWHRGWMQVDRPEAGDAVHWRLAGGSHIGVVVAPGRVLHAAVGAGVVVSRLGPKHRAAGYYRPRAAADAAPTLATAPAGYLTIRVVPDLFEPGGRSTLYAEADGSAVGSYLPAGWEREPEAVSVVRNGRRIPRGEWADVVAEAGDELVVSRSPRFGAALFASLGAETGGALLTATGSLTVLGTIIATAANIVLGIGLSYVTQALIAPAGLPDRATDEGSPTYNLAGLRNSLRPGRPIPVLYGTLSTAGQVIQAYYDVEDDGRAVIYVLVCISQGEIESIGGLTNVDRVGGASIPDAFKINGNPAKNYSGVRVSTRTGLTDQDVIPGFRDAVVATSYEVTLDDGVPFTHTTSGVIDGFQLNFYWPRGLGELDINSGDILSKTVHYLVEWRRVGTTTWSSSGPLSTTRASTAQFNTKFKIGGLARDRYEVRVTLTSPVWPPNQSQEFFEMQLKAVNEILSDDLNYPDLALVGWEAVATNQLNGGLPTFTIDDVKAKKVWVWDGVSQAAPTFTKQWSESPIWCASDLITNKRYGLGSFYDAGTIDLAAAAAAETFLAELVADGRGGTHRRGVCNFALDTTHKGWDAIQKMLAPFRVAPIKYGRRVTFRVEKSAVVAGSVVLSQMFSMGNIVQGSFRMVFRNPAVAANVVEVGFPNEETNFEADVIPRIDDAALQAGAPLIKSTVSYQVVTHPGRAARAAQFLLNLELANPHTIEFSGLLDAVAVEPGDVFGFQHDVVNEAVGGRSPMDQSPGVLILDVDLVVPPADVRWKFQYRTMVAGVETMLAVYVPAGTYVAGADIFIVDATGVLTMFSTPPMKGDVYACGPTSKVLLPYRVVDLTLNPDFTRRLMAVQYVDAIYDDDPGTVPTATDRLPSKRLHPEAVTGLRILERSLRQRDGTVTQSAEVCFESGRGEACDVYVRRAGA